MGAAPQDAGGGGGAQLRNSGTPVRRTGRRKCQKDINFVLALYKAHVLALNTPHVLRLNKADVLALNKAHVLRLTTKTCSVYTANTKETTSLWGGGQRPPPLCWL